MQNQNNLFKHSPQWLIQSSLSSANFLSIFFNFALKYMKYKYVFFKVWEQGIFCLTVWMLSKSPDIWRAFTCLLPQALRCEGQAIVYRVWPFACCGVNLKCSPPFPSFTVLEAVEPLKEESWWLEWVTRDGTVGWYQPFPHESHSQLPVCHHVNSYFMSSSHCRKEKTKKTKNCSLMTSWLW